MYKLLQCHSQKWGGHRVIRLLVAFLSQFKDDARVNIDKVVVVQVVGQETSRGTVHE